MKFCEKCGAQLEDDVKFCDECGTPVSNEEEETVVSTPVLNEQAEAQVAEQAKTRTTEDVKNKERKGISVVVFVLTLLLILAIGVCVGLVISMKSNPSIETSIQSNNEETKYAEEDSTDETTDDIIDETTVKETVGNTETVVDDTYEKLIEDGAFVFECYKNDELYNPIYIFSSRLDFNKIDRFYLEGVNVQEIYNLANSDYTVDNFCLRINDEFWDKVEPGIYNLFISADIGYSTYYRVNGDEVTSYHDNSRCLISPSSQTISLADSQEFHLVLENANGRKITGSTMDASYYNISEDGLCMSYNTDYFSKYEAGQFISEVIYLDDGTTFNISFEILESKFIDPVFSTHYIEYMSGSTDDCLIKMDWKGNNYDIFNYINYSGYGDAIPAEYITCTEEGFIISSEFMNSLPKGDYNFCIEIYYFGGYGLPVKIY